MRNEICIANVIFENILCILYSYVVNDCVAADGPATTFYIYEGVSAAYLEPRRSTPIFIV
ncbi:hypothetical protein N7491_009175 [Penicillium cf. griseofulvum]|nr:hypothetical protein N7491_009175 [Penicillium cf. griseofulvum]